MRACKWVCTPTDKVHIIRIFPGHALSLIKARRNLQNSVKRRGWPDAQSSTILTLRLIAISFRFRFGPGQRFIAAPHPPK